MKTQHIIITIHFLELLRKGHEQEEKLIKVQAAFAHLLEKEELIKILEMIYRGEAHDEHKDLDNKSKEELLSIIGDQYYILDYLIEGVFGEYTL